MGRWNIVVDDVDVVDDDDVVVVGGSGGVDIVRLNKWIADEVTWGGEGDASSPRTSISSESESIAASLLARDSRPPFKEKSTGLSVIFKQYFSLIPK